MKLKIGTKITSGFMVMMTLIMLLGGYSIFSLRSLKEDVQAIGDASDRAGLSMKVELELKESVAAIRAFIAYGDEKYYRATEEAMNETLKLDDELLKIVQADKKQETKNLRDLTMQYKKSLLNELAPLARAYHKELNAGNLAAAESIKSEVIKSAGRIIPITNELSKTTKKIEEENNKIMQARQDEAESAADNIIRNAIIINIVAILIAIVLSIYFTRMIRKPIILMLDRANKYASGDLHDDIVVTSADELGELATALSVMRRNFTEMIKKIAASAEQVAASSEELTAGADQSAQAANQVAGSIESVAEGASRQLQAVVNASAVVQQMSASLQQVAASASMVSTNSNQAASKATEGGRSIDKAVTQMIKVQETVNSSAQVVVALGNRSKEIGQIVSTISGIAGQTNLLALNAAIEAARAGEQGRGFAVVAEEVRKLAEQSQEAAKRIAELIGSIQTDTDHAVVSMNAGTAEVRVGAEVVNTAGTAFREIEDIVISVTEQIKDISTSIQQMAEGSQQIVSSVREIDLLSKAAVEETETVSAATEEQSASMQEIAASSQGLARMAQDLQGAVSRFRI